MKQLEISQILTEWGSIRHTSSLVSHSFLQDYTCLGVNAVFSVRAKAPLTHREMLTSMNRLILNIRTASSNSNVLLSRHSFHLSSNGSSFIFRNRLERRSPNASHTLQMSREEAYPTIDIHSGHDTDITNVGTDLYDGGIPMKDFNSGKHGEAFWFVCVV